MFKYFTNIALIYYYNITPLMKNLDYIICKTINKYILFDCIYFFHIFKMKKNWTKIKNVRELQNSEN